MDEAQTMLSRRSCGRQPYPPQGEDAETPWLPTDPIPNPEPDAPSLDRSRSSAVQDVTLLCFAKNGVRCFFTYFVMAPLVRDAPIPTLDARRPLDKQGKA